ncbi:MAG: hypothetical protein M1820_003583 [Bogoriella megaspora]|nr:MAG: hypothetical protein M1820_003583 [Bogoriella megaspora]
MTTRAAPSPMDSPLHTSHDTESDQDVESIREALSPSYERRYRNEPSRSTTALTASNPHFTFRALLAGLFIGVLICFCNMYFGLQAGWGSSMSLQGALLGFAIFKAVRARLVLPFSPAENVLVQSVASAVGSMAMGGGWTGIFPAMEFLLEKSEGSPVDLSLGRLVTWSLGVSLFGSVFALTLRKRMVIREKLKFPTGTATALLIRVLHGKLETRPSRETNDTAQNEEEAHRLLAHTRQSRISSDLQEDSGEEGMQGISQHSADVDNNSQRNIRLLFRACFISALYTLTSYFIPQIRDIPVFGSSIASQWLWTLSTSPAYVGQGAIIGTATTLHMLLGAIVGWGILSPMAKYNGWAPGSIDNWEKGSKGWIMWISLGIILGDSLTNLAWLILKPLVTTQRQPYKSKGRAPSTRKASTNPPSPSKDPGRDAPPHQLVSTKQLLISLPLALAVCVVFVFLSFGSYISLPLTILATLLAIIASAMGVRALGETDICPAPGISKLTQLLFAIIVPKTNPNAIIINLLAGGISDAGANQASDLMQDIKTGHLLQASPKAQYYGQVAGSILGAIISPMIYRLYVAVYELPSHLFQMPGVYIWMFSARLITGSGLPPMVWQYGLVAGILSVIVTIIRICLEMHGSARSRRIKDFIPSGVGFAVGIYITPSFSIGRAIGGVLKWWYLRNHKKEETLVVVIASGLILGEGVFSMVNLGFAGLNIPHL